MYEFSANITRHLLTRIKISVIIEEKTFILKGVYMKKIKLLILSLVISAALLSLSSCFLMGAFPCEHFWSDADCDTAMTCIKCGEVYGSPLGHNYSVRITPPTCTEDGLRETVCVECGKISSSRPDEPASGHTESDWIFDVPVTETEDGKRHTECTVCGVVIKPVETVPSHTHNMVSVTEKSPSCTEAGYSAYEYCSTCGISTYKELPAIGHAFGEWTSAGDGTHFRTCENDPSHREEDSCSGGIPTPDTPGICILCGGSYTFAVREGGTAYGYNWLGTLEDGEAMQALYIKLQASAEKFVGDYRDIADEQGYYIIDEIDFSENDLTTDEAMAVWKIFYIDNPVYYWISSSVVTKGEAILLTVGEEYKDGSYRIECDAYLDSLEAAVVDIVDDGMSELERAAKLLAFISANLEYAYEADGVTPEDGLWAHNIMGLARHGSGVCETYAKGFLYLGELIGLDVIMGTGIADGGPHAWNYVRIDESWYGIDLTWTDISGDKAVFDRFGMSAALTSSDHTLYSADPSNSIDFNYTPPALADENIELTTLYKNGEYLGMYIGIDEALAAVTDPSAEYTVLIDYYSDKRSPIEHSLAADSLPMAKSIALVGGNISYGAQIVDYNTPVVLLSPLTVSVDLLLKDVSVKGSGITVLSGQLTIGGRSTKLEERLTANFFTSSVLVTATDKAYLMSGAEAYKFALSKTSGGVFLGEDSKFTYFYGTAIYVPTGSDINVDVVFRKEAV